MNASRFKYDFLSFSGELQSNVNRAVIVHIEFERILRETEETESLFARLFPPRRAQAGQDPAEKSDGRGQEAEETEGATFAKKPAARSPSFAAGQWRSSVTARPVGRFPQIAVPLCLLCSLIVPRKQLVPRAHDRANRAALLLLPSPLQVIFFGLFFPLHPPSMYLVISARGGKNLV